jgi:hypothetical protein
MYYHLEQLVNGLWVSTALLLQGDFHKHTTLLETLRRKANADFRAKRIIDEHAVTLISKGFKVLKAPKDLNEEFSDT